MLGSKGKYQVSSDAFSTYALMIPERLSDRTSFGRIVKIHKPGRVEVDSGDPDLDETENTYIDRINGTLRQWSKR